MKKLIVIGLIIAGGGFWVWRKLPEWKAEGPTQQSLSSRPDTAVATTRTINFRVMAAGDIGPAEQVSVRPEINGRILTLPVDIGDNVKKGEILFTLDDTDLQIERSQRVTEIEGAKLQVEKAERNYHRSQELFGAQLISNELFDDTRTEFDLAKNALQRSEKNLGLLEERLTKTQIVAPFDCTVLTRPVSIGQAVSGSGGFNSGTEVLTIADLNNMVVNAHVNQADVTRLASNQEVDIQVESVPGLALQGTVERVAPQSTIKNGIKGYAARIVIAKENIDPRIRPGMTANLSIPVASAEDAVAVPLAAVFTEQGERFVLVKKGDAVEKRPVTLGIADYDFAEIQSGLSAGEVVALEDGAAKILQPNGAPRDGGAGLAGGRPAPGAVSSGALGGAARRDGGSRAESSATPAPSQPSRSSPALGTIQKDKAASAPIGGSSGSAATGR